MLAVIEKSRAEGVVCAPPSKSMAHRLLICAALSNGISEIRNIAYSEDILATIDCLKSIGAKFEIKENSVVVSGTNPKNIIDETTVFCRESGSTLRFILPLLLLSGKRCTLKGSDYLLKRPMDVYEELCKKNKMDFDVFSDSIKVKGPLQAGEFVIKGNVSSQFISGMLFALPLLHSDSKIKILPPIESRSYIDMTVDALKTFGVFVDWLTDDTLFVKGDSQYIPTSVTVEGDYSNAAFYEAFCRIGGKISVGGLNSASLQGDKVYNTLFELIENGYATVDVSDCPDLAPILITMAAMKNGAIFTGTSRLKMKESDRGVAISTELKKFGANITIEENRIIVKKSTLYTPDSVLCGHNDHRIVMSLAVISSVYGGKISGAEAVSKSFPDFFEKIKSLGIKVMLNEN